MVMEVRSGLKKLLKTPSWVQFFQTFSDLLTQSSFAVFICVVADISAGVFIVSSEYYLQLVPGLLALIPGAIAVRGNTYAPLGARMSTYLHTGELSTDLREKELLNQLFLSSTAQNLVLSVILALCVNLILLWVGLPAVPIGSLVFISVVGGVLAGLFLFLIAIVISVGSFRRGWDPDNVTTPLIMTLGDIITVPSIFLATYISLRVPADFISLLLLAICMLFLITATWKRYHISRRIMIESLPVLIGGVFLATITGVLLEGNLTSLIMYSAILMLIPAFNGAESNLGSILASRLSTGSRLGLFEAEILPGRDVLGMIGALLFLSMLIFPVIGGLTHIIAISIGFSSPGFLELITLCGIAGLVATTLSVIIAYYSNYLSLRYGVDPDSIVIPVIASLMDLMGTIMVIGAMIILLL